MFAPIVPALFDRSVAPFLGIEMPTVGTGIASYAVLGTSLTGAWRPKTRRAVQTAGGFDVTDADPRRLTGSFLIRKEDLAKLPNLEPALRENLSMVLSDEADKQFVNGNNTAPNLNGILQQLTNPDAPRPVPRRSRATRPRSPVTSMGCGRPCRRTSACLSARTRSGICCPSTAPAKTRPRPTNSRRRSTAAFAQAGASRTPRSNIQQAIVRRSNPAGDRVAVAPIWMGMELLRDPYTKAREGQVQITGTVLNRRRRDPAQRAFVQDSFRVA